MPLPEEAISVRGGCNCGAIRYKIEIPALRERPFHFSVPPEAHSNDASRLPMVVSDFCNDCRGATSSILPAWILTPEAMFTISCLSEDSDSSRAGAIYKSPLMPRGQVTDAGRPPYLPGYEILSGNKEDARDGTWLRLYVSTEAKDSQYNSNVARSFCGRCGTNIGYTLFPMPLGIAATVDVTLGSVDRDCLEKNYLQPERQLWSDYSIPWVREVLSGRLGPNHPTYDITKHVAD